MMPCNVNTDNIDESLMLVQSLFQSNGKERIEIQQKNEIIKTYLKSISMFSEI